MQKTHRPTVAEAVRPFWRCNRGFKTSRLPWVVVRCKSSHKLLGKLERRLMVKAKWLLFIVVFGLVISVRGANADGRPETLEYVHMHAWLMWSSFCFLLPLGAIVVRLKRLQSDSTLPTVSQTQFSSILFSAHVTLQCVGAGTASAGIAVLLVSKGWKLSHTHQKLGMALWLIALVMPFIGMLHPTKGTKAWPYWFVVHWLVGTGVIILGIVNAFIGIHIYQDFLHLKISFLNIAFTVQVAAMGLAYFLEDRWSYIFGEGINENSMKPAGKSNKNTLTKV